MLRETTPQTVHEAPVAGAPVTPRPLERADFWAMHQRGFVIATLAAPLLAFLGALGTDALPFWPRLVYWLILMESGALIGFGVSTGVQLWGRLRGHRFAEGTLIASAIALPLTLIVVAVTALFFAQPVPGVRVLPIMFAAVFVISAVITAINYAVNARADAVLLATPVVVASPAAAPAAGSAADPAFASASVSAAGPAPVPAPVRLLDRLPPPHRAGPIYALEAEDHYLRVHTAAGSTLILMRLSDALAELEATDGAQTHRSWWVARDAIESIDRGDGRATLRITGDVTVPVSRTQYRTLRDAGWF